MTARLREIPYNYTSFSDREIVHPPARRRRLGDAARTARERRTGRSARMLYEVLGDIWVVQRNPYLQDDLLDNPKRRAAADRSPAPPPGRDRQAPPRSRRRGRRRDAKRAGGARERASARARARRGRRLRARLRRDGGAAAQARCVAQPQHTRRTTSSSTAWRASRTSPTPPTGASNTRSSCSPRHRGRDRRAGARLHRARPHHHSARRRHRLHRRRGAADPPAAVINTEKLEALGEVEQTALPGVARAGRRPCAAAPASSRERVTEAAERAGCVFAVDPTSADASCIGGNIAMNAGGKKAVLWGTALDNLASWRMVDARRQLARGRRASTTTSARSTTPSSRASSCSCYRRRRQARSSAAEIARNSRRARSARRASART